MDAFTLVAKLTLNRAEFDRGMNQIESDINSPQKTSTFSAWGVAVGNLAAKAFSKAFSAASGFAQSIITTGMDFDSMMSEVKAVGGMTEEEFEKVRQKAIDLGASTKFTSKEVGQAFYYMGLAGWNAEEMLGGIEGVLNLAAASGEDLGTVSDIVTDAITAFGMSAEDTAHFVDVLAAASSNSNTTVAMMGEAFKYLATTGGMLGYTVDDIAVALGLLANNGIKSSQAGTYMRQILTSLVAPTDAASMAMDALGISLFESDGKVKPFMQVMNELRGVLENSGFDLAGNDIEEYQRQMADLQEQLEQGKITQEQFDESAHKLAVNSNNQDFLAALKDIFGVRGITAALAIMKSSSGDFKQLTDSVTQSEGSASTMAETMINNLEGDITLLNSALDGLKILMSDEYKDSLRGFVSIFTEEIGKLGEAFEEGGISGMLINLTDWIINGITDTLSNPEITVDGANKFGQALGDFVGHLVKTLIENAPEIMKGLFTAGMNLAGGIVQGMFAGLFGTGEGTIYGFLNDAEEERDGLIADANATAAEANGIVAYMDSLVAKYGEAATQSDEWADAMGRLESLIPGITASIKEEGEELNVTTGNFREYIEQHRLKAIEDAKKAYVGDLRTKYEESQTALGQAQVNQEIALYTQQEAARAMAEMYLANRQAAEAVEGKGYRAVTDELGLFNTVDEILDALASGKVNVDSLMSYLGYSQNESDASTFVELSRAYEEAKGKYEENTQQIVTLTESAQKLQIQLDIAEAAVARLAERANTADVGNGSDGGYKQAKGDWFVPYDDYPSLLHRGEMVLTASQARQYRNGNGQGVDVSALTDAIVTAVRAGMESAQVNAYMDGRKVSAEVSRVLHDQLMLAR